MPRIVFFWVLLVSQSWSSGGLRLLRLMMLERVFSLHCTNFFYLGSWTIVFVSGSWTTWSSVQQPDSFSSSHTNNDRILNCKRPLLYGAQCMYRVHCTSLFIVHRTTFTGLVVVFALQVLDFLQFILVLFCTTCKL